MVGHVLFIIIFSFICRWSGRQTFSELD